MRIVLAMAAPVSKKEKAEPAGASAPNVLAQPCPCCGGRMIVIETFDGSCRRRRPVPARPGIDTS
jgi:hypothetical protein